MLAKSLKFPREGWWVNNHTDIWMCYMRVKMFLHRIRYKHIVTKDYKLFFKDRILFWRPAKDSGAMLVGLRFQK